MRHVLKAMSGLLLSAAICVLASAQREPKGRTEPGIKTNPGSADDGLSLNQQSALYLLDQLFESTKAFDDDRLKIRTQAQVADLLWSYDEPRARRLFEEAFRSIASAKLPGQSDVPFLGVSLKTPSPPLALQSEILALVARHDPAFAEKLIKAATENLPGKESAPQPQPEAEKNSRPALYLQAALSIAATDPERAAQLAKVGLAGGINPTVLRILLALRQTNRAVADDFFRSALAVARRDIKTDSSSISILAPYAMPDFMTAGFHGDASSHDSGAPAPAGSPVTAEFLNFAYEMFLQLSGTAAQFGVTPGESRPPAVTNPADYITGQRLLPSFIRYMPDKAAAFRQALDLMARNIPQGVGPEIIRMFQPASASDLVEQAQSEKNTVLRDLTYLRAAAAAAGGGEFAQALSITDSIEDQGRRDNFGSIIRSQAVPALLKKNEFETALRFARGVSDARQRALLFAKIARALLDRRDSQRTEEVLNEAEQTTGKADDGVEKAHALLIITEVKSRLDPARGFETLEAAVKAFNRADSGAEKKGQAAAGGSPGLAILNSMLKPDAPDFGPSFSRLARADFNRAVFLARSLERKERSISAQLAVCRAVLTEKREKKVRELNISAAPRE